MPFVREVFFFFLIHTIKKKKKKKKENVTSINFFFLVASVSPVTIEEHMLYTTLSAVLKIPYKRPLSSQPGQQQQQQQQLPLPLQCLFLEMTVRYNSN